MLAVLVLMPAARATASAELRAGSDVSYAPLEFYSPAKRMQGFDIDWRGLYRGREPRRIELPGYPFARDEYWLPETVQGRAESAAPQADGLSRLMETLGRIEDSTLSPAEGARLLKNLV